MRKPRIAFSAGTAALVLLFGVVAHADECPTAGTYALTLERIEGNCAMGVLGAETGTFSYDSDYLTCQLVFGTSKIDGRMTDCVATFFAQGATGSMQMFEVRANLKASASKATGNASVSLSPPAMQMQGGCAAKFKVNGITTGAGKASVSPKVSQSSTKAFCSECGAAIDPSAKFCSSCGKAVSAPAPVTKERSSGETKGNGTDPAAVCNAIAPPSAKVSTKTIDSMTALIRDLPEGDAKATRMVQLAELYCGEAARLQAAGDATAAKVLSAKGEAIIALVVKKYPENARINGLVSGSR